MTLFETLFPEIYTNSTTYNLVKIKDSEILLELNVAGVEESDVSVEVCGNTLVVSSEPKDGREYIYKGVHKRALNHKFSLRDDVCVKEAHIKNGILGITLEIKIPEKNKLRKIPITH